MWICSSGINTIKTRIRKKKFSFEFWKIFFFFTYFPSFPSISIRYVIGRGGVVIKDSEEDGDKLWLTVPLPHFNFIELHVIAIHSSLGGSGGKLFVWHLTIDENGPDPIVFTARIRILK
jgi:hypothetical protein